MNIKFIFPTLFLAVTVLGSSLLAQQVDVDKMDRDLKVAAAALGTLVETKQELLLARREDRQTAQYLEGYGVMMTLPAQHSVTVLAPNVYRGAGTAQIRGVEPSSQRRTKVGKTFDQGAGASQIRGFEPSSPTGTIRIGKSLTETADAPKQIDRDSLSQVQTDQLKEQVTIFLLEYADLIGQLQAEDRIKIVEERSPFVTNRMFLQNRPRYPTIVNRDRRFSAEIKKSDLTSFKAGELSREEVVGRILFSESLAEGLDQDLELLANIMDRLYRPDLSETFYYTGYAYYDKIPEFGVIYHLNMLTRTEKNLYNFVLPSDEKEDLNEESDPEKLTALYPKFLEGIKEHILTYGRTVKSMDRKERLVFNIRLSNCTGCEVPDWVNVSIGMADLFDYDEGKISRTEVLERFKVGVAS